MYITMEVYPLDLKILNVILTRCQELIGEVMNRSTFYFDLIVSLMGYVLSIWFVAYVLYKASSDQLSYILCFSLGVALFMLSRYALKNTILTRCQERI